MPSHAATRLSSFVPLAVLLAVAAGCGSATAPSPTQLTETFTGTLQPLGTDFKTFTIVYTQASSDLSVTVDSLKTVAASTPVTGITIGIGFGAVSGSSCSLQIQTPTAALATELFAPNGASAGIVLRPDLRLPDWNDRLLLDAHGTRHVFDDREALLTTATTAGLSTNAPGGRRYAQSEHGYADKDASEDPESLLPQSSGISLCRTV